MVPVSLLEGRRSITSATLTASSEKSGNSPSTATLSNDDGWCSTGQQRTTIPSIYLQVNFHTDVLISSVVTEGFSGFFDTYYTQQYKIQIAGSNGEFRFVAASTDSSVAAVSDILHICCSPVVNLYVAFMHNSYCMQSHVILQTFPQNMLLIPNESRHIEQLPTTVLGQTLRLLPTQYSDADHACTKVEVIGCPLLGM